MCVSQGLPQLLLNELFFNPKLWYDHHDWCHAGIKEQFAAMDAMDKSKSVV